MLIRPRILAIPLVAAIVLVMGCGQPQAAPTPVPSRSVATSQPAATSTQAQPGAAQVDYPTKGKPVAFIVPWPAGGGTDVGARVLAPALEKQLGVPVAVVNKPGAAAQVGTTELAKAKPDGYTIGYTNLPGTFAIYLDTERKPTFGRKDFEPVALHISDPATVTVAADSPYKSMKDLVDAARANPGKLQMATGGVMSFDHLNVLQVMKETDTKFGQVHFDGAGPQINAVLGGHVDVIVATVGSVLQQCRNGKLRALGVMSEEDSKFLPGVKTMKAQGYELTASALRGISLPAGTPKPIVDTLSAAVKKAMETDEVKKRTDELGLPLTYMDAAQFATFWDKFEKDMVPYLEQARQDSKKQ